MNNMNPEVDPFFNKAAKWQAELVKMRAIVLDCQLTEELKWRQPCYTHGGKNVIILGGFKEYCALMFFKGSLLKDSSGLLIQQTENVQGARQIRFTNVQEIIDIEPIIKAYIHEAIEIEKSGIKVNYDKNRELVYPEEFQTKLDEFPALRSAFEGLTPGRRRAYNLYFAQAKQSKTRNSRVEKCMPRILEGKGLND